MIFVSFSKISGNVIFIIWLTESFETMYFIGKKAGSSVFFNKEYESEIEYMAILLYIYEK